METLLQKCGTFTRLKDEMTSQALPSTNTAYGTAVIYGRSDSHHFSWAGAGSYHTCILILFIETTVGTYYRSRVVPHPKPGKNPKQIIGGNVSLMYLTGSYLLNTGYTKADMLTLYLPLMTSCHFALENESRLKFYRDVINTVTS